MPIRTAKPKPPPEARLIRTRRQGSIRAIAPAAGLSEGRWRQIECGYQTIAKGVMAVVHAPVHTVARMAFVVGCDPEDFHAIDRADIGADLQQLLDRWDGAMHYGIRVLPELFESKLTGQLIGETSPAPKIRPDPQAGGVRVVLPPLAIAGLDEGEIEELKADLLARAYQKGAEIRNRQGNGFADAFIEATDSD